MNTFVVSKLFSSLSLFSQYLILRPHPAPISHPMASKRKVWDRAGSSVPGTCLARAWRGNVPASWPISHPEALDGVMSASCKRLSALRAFQALQRLLEVRKHLGTGAVLSPNLYFERSDQPAVIGRGDRELERTPSSGCRRTRPRHQMPSIQQRDQLYVPLARRAACLRVQSGAQILLKPLPLRQNAPLSRPTSIAVARCVEA